MDFHDRLMLIMDQRGLKQVDICRLTGLSSAQVNHLVNGKTKDPKLSTAVMVADALDVSLDYLAGRNNSSPPPSFSDARQQTLNYSYSLLDDRSKGELAGFALTMTADPSRLASKSGQGAEDSVNEEGAA